ncbi:MAG: transglycosylase domain-containing protein, partial [Rhodoferax sp.]|uniref:transglycosylase domain-containing protein n=1 Tax=Rhodoferax sp. TaxID=50421 RepID=UPI003266F330
MSLHTHHTPTPRTQSGKLWLTALWVCGGLGLIGGLLIAIAAAWYYPSLPDLDKVTRYQPQQAMQVYTSDGVEIAQFGSERRVFLPIAQIPPLMQEALLAIEDTRFREHSGIDPIGVLRAVVSNLTGGVRQGASTITQQVARNFFLSNRKTIERKFKEAMLALKIEKSLTKDQILELYMNQIYLGHRAYGFGAASQVYFGKPLADLSIAEMAMLAGLPQNPAYANPITNLERATRRQQLVLGRMLSVGVISQAQFDTA